MRITNRIMQRNNLSNINTNKIYQDKLSTQMSSQKKINRPSDDPVVAIRALRLRSNVTEITQYYTKNIPDAESWLKVTEDAISSLADIIKSMKSRCEKAVSSYLNTQNRQIILEEMQNLGQSIYATGDSDYAGRYVFTGYRTDTSLSFLEAMQQNYTITEQLDKGAIDSVIKVDTDKLKDINSSTYENIDVDEDDISSVEVYRIRLAYNDCSDYGKAYEDLKKAQNGLVDDVTKNAAAVNTALAASGVQIGNVDLGNLSDDEKAELKKAVDAVVTDMESQTPPDQEAIDKLKSWEDNPKEILGDYYKEINDKLKANNSMLADNATIMQIGDAADFALINNNFTNISGAMGGTWGTDWTTNKTGFADLKGGPKIEFTDPTTLKKVEWGGFAEGGGDITLMHSYEDPYVYAAENDDAIVYIPETGEILLGKNRYGTLMGTKDSEATSTVNEAEIRVTYDKSDWKKGDLRPEHYFYCEAEGENGADPVIYNDTYLTPNAERQVIEYDVGYNQNIRINSTADECFKHGIGREVDDIVNAMQDVLDLEGTVASIQNIMDKLPADDKSRPLLQKQLDAANKALTLAMDKEQKLFEKGMTTFQKYHDDATLCVTNCGSRSSKLELIKNRSQNQKTTYETLKSENEDIDITEVAIELGAAELVYNAALMAAGKVTQTTLLNYI